MIQGPDKKTKWTSKSESATLITLLFRLAVFTEPKAKKTNFLRAGMRAELICDSRLKTERAQVTVWAAKKTRLYGQGKGGLNCDSWLGETSA